jgi:tetratricopeptide (TPR) repeat protein
LSPEEAYPKAQAALDKASALDSNLAEVHTTRGHMLHSFVGNWPEIEREFKRAIQLNPKYATAHYFYAVYLGAVGKVDEAGTEFQQALQLEPLSLPINTWLGRYYYYRRQYDASIQQFHKALDIDQNFANAHLMLGWTYEVRGMHKESISEFTTGRILSGNNPTLTAALIYAEGKSGRGKDAKALLDTLLQLSHRRFVSPNNIAIAYAGLGDNEKFFEWMKKAIDAHSFIVSVGEFNLDPIFDFARNDPRFIALMKTTGLAQ